MSFIKYPLINHLIIFLLTLMYFIKSQDGESQKEQEETPVCGGFLEFDQNVNPELKKQIDYSSIIVQSFTMDMILKEHTNLAASGYYFLPVYENESFILKISGPYGMNFEPEQYVFTIDGEKSVRDICQQDINFKFRGYVVEGQVSTFGSNDGPEGISLALLNEQNQKVQTTKTVEKGLFRFNPVIPGNYIIRPVDDIHMFDKDHSEFKFKVNISDNNFFERALIIRGYKLKGKVEADHAPLENVLVFIYSYNSTLIKNYNCEGIKAVENLSDFTFKDMVPFCVTTSEKNGMFLFKNIPYGQFLIRPLFKNKYISYTLEPDHLAIDIEHKDLVIENPFQVTAFSIYGKVINSRGNGIPNVTIKIDGQVRAVTDSNGIYKLENLTPGNYDLEAQADDMFFEPLTNIRITAHLKSLQDVIVTDYKLCGKIIIEATEYFSTSKRTVVLQDASDKSSSKKERRTITDQKGRYCFEVKTGMYHIYPVLTQDEKDSDLHLQPEFHDLEVIDRPILDANFYQSKVKVAGSVKCLKDCGSDVKVKLVSTKTDRMLTAMVNERNQFEFKDILSGQYKLAIIKPEWCWDSEDIIVKVQNTNIDNLTFSQIGYSLFYSSQHNIDIEWENINTNQKKLTTLDKSKNKICLPSEGTHKVTPKSCLKFKQDFFMYDTHNTNKIEFIPLEFLTRGTIELDEKVVTKLQKQNLTELKVTLIIDELSSKRIPYKKLHIVIKGFFTVFHFYTKPDIHLIITPSIHAELAEKEEYKNFLFLPKDKQIEIKQECLEDETKMKFVMKSGLMIVGKVTPGMDGVMVSAFNKASGDLVASTSTNEEGHYKIGPLYTENEYLIKATKDGYKIVSEGKNPYNFNAEKLSFLRVKIQDTTGRPLSSVFLSLSSADRGFKINNNTNSEGYYDFVELYSGEYYIKPLFKEYRFEPHQKLVKILGGQHYEETLIAHRIAFSIYGKINNLNKEKVEGLYIQAYNEKTRQLQETAIDKNGEYRLKGLLPGHKYNIKVKIPPNSSIEKALPPTVPITLGEEDAIGVDFVVLQRPKKIDIRGYLNYTDEEDKCPLGKAQNTYVELSKPDDDEDQSIKTKPVSNSCQFVFRNLEKIKYHIKVLEKQGKMSPTPRILTEYTVDLADERDINNGVKILKMNIEKIKKSTSDSLNYTIYSPIFLFLLIFSVLKWDYTVWLFNNVFCLPFSVIAMIFSRKRKRY